MFDATRLPLYLDNATLSASAILSKSQFYTKKKRMSYTYDFHAVFIECMKKSVVLLLFCVCVFVCLFFCFLIVGRGDLEVTNV